MTTSTATRFALATGLLFLSGLPDAAAQCPPDACRAVRGVEGRELTGTTEIGDEVFCRFAARGRTRTVCSSRPQRRGIAPLDGDEYPPVHVGPIVPGQECEFMPLPPPTAWCRDITAPSCLTAVAHSGAQVRLVWFDNSNRCECTDEDGCPPPEPAWWSFRIERKSNGGVYSLLATVGGATTSYIDSDADIQGGVTYTYRIQAVDSFAETPLLRWPYTNEAAILMSLLPAPTDLVAVAASSSRVDLGWIDRSDDEDGFQIERRSGAGSFEPLATVWPNVNYYSDPTVAAQTTYVYRVRAFKGDDQSSYAVSPSVTTPAGGGGGGAPAAPCCLRARPEWDNRGPFVVLQWGDQSSDETGFRVERRAPGQAWVVLARLPAGAISLIDDHVLPGTSYVYRVVAYNPGGESASTEVPARP